MGSSTRRPLRILEVGHGEEEGESDGVGGEQRIEGWGLRGEAAGVESGVRQRDKCWKMIEVLAEEEASLADEAEVLARGSAVPGATAAATAAASTTSAATSTPPAPPSACGDSRWCGIRLRSNCSACAGFRV